MYLRAPIALAGVRATPRSINSRQRPAFLAGETGWWGVIELLVGAIVAVVVVVLALLGPLSVAGVVGA